MPYKSKLNFTINQQKKETLQGLIREVKKHKTRGRNSVYFLKINFPSRFMSPLMNLIIYVPACKTVI